MKMSELTYSHVLKIRNEDICYLAEREGEMVAYTKDYFGKYSGVLSVTANFNKNEELTKTRAFDSEFDIVGISKKFKSQNEAILAVVQGKEIEWDIRTDLVEITLEQIAKKFGYDISEIVIKQ